MVYGKYLLTGNRVGFDVAGYDKTKPLVIDPTLAYSTYLGGNDYDVGNGIAVDASGNAYVAGNTASSDFPNTTGAFQTKNAGGGSGCCGQGDAFVSKLNAAGSALVYSTYLGGSSNDAAYGITVDAGGNVYVTGGTFSSDFPTTQSAFQTAAAGGGDAFVSKLNTAGSALVYSTYLGGTKYDGGSGIAVDASGNGYVLGGTDSSDFPTTPGVFQPTHQGPFAAFVTKLNASGSALLYSTYLGAVDFTNGIAVDVSGDVYVTGFTVGGFPTTPGAFQTAFAGNGGDAFISKLNAVGSALLYSTYLGGSVTAGFESDTFVSSLAIDASGSAYITGATNCTDFLRLIIRSGPTSMLTFGPTLGVSVLFSLCSLRL